MDALRNSDSAGLEEPPEMRLMKALSSVGTGYGGSRMIAALPEFLADSPSMISNESGAARLGEGKGYAQQKYPTSLPVKAYTEPGVPFYDEIKGLNKGHALYNAKNNWPGVDVQPTGLSGKLADKAQTIVEKIADLSKQYKNLKGSGF